MRERNFVTRNLEKNVKEEKKERRKWAPKNSASLILNILSNDRSFITLALHTKYKCVFYYFFPPLSYPLPPSLTPPVASPNPDHARMQPDHASLRDDINPNGCYPASIYSGSSRNRSFVSAVLLPPSLSLFASSPFPLVTHRNLTHEWTSRDLYLYQSVKVPHPLLILFRLAGN